MNRCSDCIFADKQNQKGVDFIKTYTCANEQSQEYGDRVRPQHSCDQHKGKDEFNILDYTA